MTTSPGAAGWSWGSTLRPITSSSSSSFKYKNPFLSYARPTVLTLSGNDISEPGFVEEAHVRRYGGASKPGSRRTATFGVSSQGNEEVVPYGKEEELATL